MRDGIQLAVSGNEHFFAGNSQTEVPNGPHGFTLVELLVVIAIIGILAVLLLPVLSRAKITAKSVRCLNNVRQIELSTKMYPDENRGSMIPLWMERGAPGVSSWTYDSSTFIIQSPNRLWWPDKLRLDGRLKGQAIFSCPSLIQPAANTVGGSASQKYTLGIGMNYPEFGWLVAAAGFPYPVYTASAGNGIAAPSQCIVFADAAMVSNPTEPDPDNWKEIQATGCAYFRVPSDGEGYPHNDSHTITLKEPPTA